MLANLETLSLQLGVTAESLMAFVGGFGILLLVLGLHAALRRPDRALVRLAAISGSRRNDRLDRALLLPSPKGPGTIMKAFLPSEKGKLGTMQRKLMQAGVTRADAVQVYTLVRIGLAIGLPAFFLVVLSLARMPDTPLPAALAKWLTGLSTLGVYQGLSVLLALGYYVPHRWLESRASARQLRIEESFPNALDLMQVSVEAGLGFDAAMIRVANELTRSAPEIAQEFLTVQLQVQAGRPRDQAMREMADRVSLETFRSFANVVEQSLHFGTSMAQAMTTYSEELRQTRELRAQEMANKLPVKMSGVMASLMLPALVLLTIGPVIIRYMQQF
jgi:tight adherence protein C